VTTHPAIATDGEKPSSSTSAVLMGVVLAVAAIAIAQSWNRWLDPIIDTGRDLYIPEQMHGGVTIYRDIAYYYPPLTPYLLALITAITGSSIAAYAGIGITIAVLTAAALYFGGRVTGGRTTAFAAAVLFAACSIAGRSTWGTNYLFPYSHAATLATLFFAVFVAFLCDFLFGRRAVGSLVVALAFALAASWTKAEYAVFTAIVIVVAFAAHQLRVAWLAAYVAVAMASVGAVSFAFRGYPPGRQWLFDNVAPATLLRSPYLRDFYREVTGLAHWPSLTARSLAGALIVVAIVALLAAADRAPARSTRTLCFGVAAAASVLLLFDDRFFRSWTVLQIALVPFALRRPREPLLILLAASLCTTSRVFFNIVPVWYGFVFVVPLYLLLSHVFFEWLPARGVFSRKTSRALLVLVIVIALQALGSAHLTYGRKTHPLVTGRGTIYDKLAGRAAAIERLRQDAPRLGIRDLVVMPEGLALNYLLHIPTPIAYYTFTPPEAADPAAEARILAEFEAKRPQWIAFVPRAVTEFGATQFGVDYDQRLMAYIRANYVTAEVIHEPGFTITLMRRRNPA
jgi:hypothetical protein